MDARELTLQLGGRWYGSYGKCPCPVCQPEPRPKQNALTLRNGDDGRLLAHCKKLDCAFANILAAAGVTPGGTSAPDPARLAQRERDRRAEAERRARQALTCWREAQPLAGTPAETYLRWRGITCALPATLRFHPACWHGAIARPLPALVALVEGCDDIAVHRTYLRADGSGKADVEPAKAMLGGTAGGAVRLSASTGRLVVAEGIETALSLASGLLSGPVAIWAALSTSGMRSLRLPVTPGQLTIASDGDAAGHAAAQALAERAHALGWRVDLLPAPEGRDWNDILIAKGGPA
ncbi:DUF7146 domain-containing protein [Rubellimicrobium roseum]|nr:toprim domain-containing protein [Rubellimicrobium roseum]